MKPYQNLNFALFTRRYIAQTLLSILIMITAGAAQASLPALGLPLSPLVISQRGEIVLTEQSVSYQPWRSQQNQQSLQLIIHAAGRLAAKRQLALLTERLQHDPRSSHWRISTVVNTQDALFGSRLFVERSLIDSKRESWQQHFIIDSQGTAAAQWQLQPESAAVLLLDKQGSVKFFHQGTVTHAQVDLLFYLLHQLDK